MKQKFTKVINFLIDKGYVEQETQFSNLIYFVKGNIQFLINEDSRDGIGMSIEDLSTETRIYISHLLEYLFNKNMEVSCQFRRKIIESHADYFLIFLEKYEQSIFENTSKFIHSSKSEIRAVGRTNWDKILTNFLINCQRPIDIK